MIIIAKQKSYKRQPDMTGTVQLVSDAQTKAK